jgi:integrase
VNPARLVRLRKENSAVVRFLEAQEEEKLRRILRDRCLEAEFDLALNTGMRGGEQYRLRWEDVNFRLGIITIPRSKHGERRYIPINSAAKIALEVLQRQADSSGYVIPGAMAPRNKDPRRTFEAAVGYSQLPVSRHPTPLCQSASDGWSRSPDSSGTDGAQDCCHDDPIFPPCSFSPERSD